MSRMAIMHERMRWLGQQPAALAMAMVCALGAIVTMLTIGASPARAADVPANGVPVVLWPNGAPNAIGKEDVDIPTLTPFWPEHPVATGTAVVVCPGGSYTHLATDH